MNEHDANEAMACRGDCWQGRFECPQKEECSSEFSWKLSDLAIALIAALFIALWASGALEEQINQAVAVTK